MTIQWRSTSTRRPHEWGPWADAIDGTEVRFNTSLASMADLEIREKSSFEPGYFVDLSLVGEDRDRSTFAGEPYQVRWFDEKPLARGWERAGVFNDHLD